MLCLTIADVRARGAVDPNSDNTPSRPLALATISFAVCFAAWGLVSASVPYFRSLYGLSATSTSLLVAIPVLLGSLARIPVGHARRPLRRARRLPDPHAARRAVPRPGCVPFTTSYRTLLAVAFLLGLAGSSFAVGVGFRLALDAAARQGSALGVYGLGNIGQSAAVFSGGRCWPRGSAGRRCSADGAVLLVVWAVAFGLLARNAPGGRAPEGARRRCCACSLASGSPGLLSLFYFLTFGGFVAFSIYLPTLLKDQFALTPADAGFRDGRASWCSRRCCARSAAGWPTASAARACSSAVFLGVVPFALLLGVAGDAAVHRGRARLRRAAGPRQRRGVQAGAAVLPRRRPARSPAWSAPWAASAASSRRCCSASSATASARSGRASCCWPRSRSLLWRVNRRVFLPRQQAVELALPPDLRAHGRSPARRRLGHALDRPARRGDRGRLAQPAEFRPGAGDLHVRHRSSRPGASSITTTSGSRSRRPASTGSAAGELLRAARACCAASASCCRTAWHAPRWRRRSSASRSRAALVDAPAPLLGLPAGGGDHVSAGLRLDPLPQRAPATR